MALLSRSRARSPETSARSPSMLTFAELQTAIDAARSQLFSECEAARTLDKLYVIFDGPAGGGLTELPPGPQAVTALAVDDAIGEASAVLGPRSATIAVLKEARAFVARAEQAERPLAPVSERVLAIALLAVDRQAERRGHADGNIRSCFERIAATAHLTREETASVKRLLELFEEIGSRYGEAERRRARGSPGQPWSTI